MNRKDKIKLINRLEIGTIPVEYFQPPTIKLEYVKRSNYISTFGPKNDEDLSLIDADLEIMKFGINPFTGSFYGSINILVILT